MIEGDDVRLAPISREVAAALLDGRAPEAIAFADGYPSQFSLEVMDIVAGPRAATADGQGFHPCFVVRMSDGVVDGEIGQPRRIHRATRLLDRRYGELVVYELA